MDAIIFTIVIDHGKAPTLIVHAKALAYRTGKPIADIVLSKIVAVIAQNKALKLFQSRKFGEKIVIQTLVAILFAEGNRNGLFLFDTAVVSKYLESGCFCKGWFTCTRFHQFDKHRDFLILPIIGAVIRRDFICSGALHINSGIRIEKRIRICRQEHRRNRRSLFKDISTYKLFSGKHFRDK